MTKGSLEADIANAAVRFQREQQGRGATEVRAHLLGNMVLVRSSGIFTPIEAKLAASEEGRRLIKSSRLELRSINHLEIEQTIAGITGCPVVRSYYDLDTEAAEQVEIYILRDDLEKRLLHDLHRLSGAGKKLLDKPVEPLHNENVGQKTI